MELYLIRHTTPDIAKGICYGQSDIGVTDTFDYESQQIIKQLPTTIDRVYSSPLQRCSLLAQTLQKPITYDNRLQELNFGDWELMPWDAIPQKDLQPWMDDFVNVSVPNGESYTTLQHRVLDFINALQHDPTAKIAIVSHAGPIRALLAHLRAIPLVDSFNTIRINYGEVVKSIL